MWSSTSHYAVSNNPGAAYWGTGGTNESLPFRTAYFAVGGWQLRGSTSRMEPAWEVCNGAGTNRLIWGCPTQFGDIHWQTFRGTAGNWRSAMVARYRNASDGPVYWVTRAFFAAYTSQYDASRVWSYWIGAPTSNEYTWIPGDPDLLRQDYEGGYYAVWRRSQCLVVLYRNGTQQALFQDTRRTCEDGGEGPAPGYGADGN